MNRILFLFLSLFLSLSVCYGQNNNFKIIGEVEGYEKGKIKLYDIYNNILITEGDVLDNKFELSGNLKETTQVLIYVDCSKGPKEKFFIYDDQIKVKINIPKREINIIGGIENKAHEIFKTINEEILKEHQKILRKTTKINIEATNKYMKKHNKNVVKCIVQNNDNISSACELKNMFGKISLDKIEKLYNNFTPRVKNTIYGKSIKNKIYLIKRLSVGNIAPNFTLKDKNNNDVTLHDVKAKIKIVDFWSTWCIPCLAEIKKLIPLYEEYKDKGLEIISVSVDDPSHHKVWLESIASKKWINLKTSGFGSEVTKKYDISSIPRLFILDENNKIIGKWKGKELKENIEKLLK